MVARPECKFAKGPVFARSPVTRSCKHSVACSFEANRFLTRNRLTNSPNGPRLCISLLDRMASLFDAEETPDATRAFELGYVLSIGA